MYCTLSFVSDINNASKLLLFRDARKENFLLNLCLVDLLRQLRLLTWFFSDNYWSYSHCFLIWFFARWSTGHIKYWKMFTSIVLNVACMVKTNTIPSQKTKKHNFPSLFYQKSKTNTLHDNLWIENNLRTQILAAKMS